MERKILLFATIYYLACGLSTFLWPSAWEFAAGTILISPLLLELIGVLLLALAGAAMLAMLNPVNNWAATATLLMQNVLDALLVATFVLQGKLPILNGIVLGAMDLFWVVALLNVLNLTAKKIAEKQKASRVELEQALGEKPLGSKESIAELSDNGPVALVFIRHSGCTFCREHLTQLAGEKEDLKKNGVRIVVVGMSSERDLVAMAEKYGVGDCLLLSDPNRKLYGALELHRGKLGQLLGPKELWHALASGALFRYGIGWIDGDSSQLQGSFIIEKRHIVVAHRAISASESCPINPMLAQMRKAEPVQF